MKKRTIQVVGDVAYVPLTKGYTALIDADDVPLVEDWNWHAVVGATTVYAARGMSAGGKSRTIILHRVLISAPDGMDVDHINGDGLDNRRANLRIATRMENLCNKSIYCNNKSGFKGVYWDRHNKRWRSRVRSGDFRKVREHSEDPSRLYVGAGSPRPSVLRCAVSPRRAAPP